jgi:hypothetical protein
MVDAKLTFESVVICDDVRFENSGKLILIGVYSSDIAVTRFPAQFGLVVYCAGEVSTEGSLVAPLRIADEEGTVIFKSEDFVQVEKQEFKSGSFAMQANAVVNLNKETTLHFYFSVNGKDTHVAKKRVVRGVPVVPPGVPPVPLKAG